MIEYAPPPRAVDWSIFACVLFSIGSGLYSFTVGRPNGFGWLFVWAHRVVGVTLVSGFD